MAKWEYMLVHGENTPGGQGLFVQTPGGGQELVNDRQGTPGNALILLNQLGEEGWDAFHVDHQSFVDSENWTYWLKRSVM